MRAGIRGKIDATAAIVATGNNGGHTHVEMGAGLSLAVHPGKAVDQPGNKELSRAVDYLCALGNRDKETRSDVGDLAVLNNDDGVLLIESGTAPVGHVGDGAAEQNQWNSSRLGSDLGFNLRKT